jgi:rfaE bifunctional protein nucleotidyltransferase chain/domain
MKKIVVNGTFDILHIGHLALLNYAKSLGDYLLVLIDSDIRVKELKGSNRPINNQLERKEFLLNLKSVDQVEIFNNQEELEILLAQYQADIMVKGGDHKNGQGTGKRFCKEVIYFDRINGYSTTEKIQNIINR